MQLGLDFALNNARPAAAAAVFDPDTDPDVALHLPWSSVSGLADGASVDTWTATAGPDRVKGASNAPVKQSNGVQFGSTGLTALAGADVNLTIAGGWTIYAVVTLPANSRLYLSAGAGRDYVMLGNGWLGTAPAVGFVNDDDDTYAQDPVTTTPNTRMLVRIRCDAFGGVDFRYTGTGVRATGSLLALDTVLDRIGQGVSGNSSTNARLEDFLAVNRDTVADGSDADFQDYYDATYGLTL